VTEISGWRVGHTSIKTPPGISVHVLDTAFNYKIVGSFRSEDIIGLGKGTKRVGREGAREKARILAEQLNGGITSG